MRHNLSIILLQAQIYNIGFRIYIFRIKRQIRQMSSYSNTQQNFYSSEINPQNYFTKNNLKLTLGDAKLWQPSETSLNFVSSRVSFSRQKRFKLQSIYWPENIQAINSTARMNKQRSDTDTMAKHISKKIDQQEKNQIRIKRKASNSNSQHQNQNKVLFSSNDKNKRRRSEFKSDRKKFVLDCRNQEVIKRLLIDSPTKKQSLLRDRHGFRSNLVDGEDQSYFEVVKDEMQQAGCSNGFKTSSKRVNLNLPHNYYPGPGAYEIKRYLQQLQMSKTLRLVMTARESVTGNKQQ